MIKLAITGKAEKRILAYPLLKASSIAGKTAFLTDDGAYKRLYKGSGVKGMLENITIYICPELNDKTAAPILKEVLEEDVEYLIIASDSYYPADVKHILMFCEQNSTFMGNYIEDVVDERDDITLATISVVPEKISLVPKGFKIHQLQWKAQHLPYLCLTEEQQELQPLKEKQINQLLTTAFAESYRMKPGEFQQLLKRKRYSYTKKDERR